MDGVLVEAYWGTYHGIEVTLIERILRISYEANSDHPAQSNN